MFCWETEECANHIRGWPSDFTVLPGGIVLVRKVAPGMTISDFEIIVGTRNTREKKCKQKIWVEEQEGAGAGGRTVRAIAWNIKEGKKECVLRERKK